MSLPLAKDLKKMDYTYLGQPFVDVPAKSSINLKTMDYTYLAQPFVSTSFGSIKDVIGLGIIPFKR